VFLAGVIAVLIGLEIVSENQIAALTDSVSDKQARLALAQQEHETLKELVQRMALESRSDRALADLLAKRGIHVATVTQDTSANAPVSSATDPAVTSTTIATP